jgi:hydroxymethylpyrimidine pyrophosphatase-like HAD family hydrolase
LSGYDCSLEIYQDGVCYLERDRLKDFYNSIPEDFADYLLEHSEVVESFRPLLNNPGTEKLNVSGLSDDLRRQARAELATGGGFTLASALAGNIEITAAGVDKGQALAWLAELADVPKTRTVAFGDSDNDASMLSWAAHSYAMPAATPEAVEAARQTLTDRASLGDALAWACRSALS